MPLDNHSRNFFSPSNNMSGFLMHSACCGNKILRHPAMLNDRFELRFNATMSRLNFCRERIVNWCSNKNQGASHLTSTTFFARQPRLITDGGTLTGRMLFNYLFCFFSLVLIFELTSKGSCMGEKQKKFSIEAGAIT